MENTKFNIDEILTEVSWRLSDGIVNFDKKESVDILRKVLTEMNYSDKFIDEFIYAIKKNSGNIVD